MKKALISLSIIFSLLFILSFGLYLYLRIDIFETLSITFGVTSYHFIMRLTIGYVLDLLLKNNVDSNIKWFQERPFEKKINRGIISMCEKYMTASRHIFHLILP